MKHYIFLFLSLFILNLPVRGEEELPETSYEDFEAGNRFSMASHATGDTEPKEDAGKSKRPEGKPKTNDEKELDKLKKDFEEMPKEPEPRSSQQEKERLKKERETRAKGIAALESKINKWGDKSIEELDKLIDELKDKSEIKDNAKKVLITQKKIALLEGFKADKTNSPGAAVESTTPKNGLQSALRANSILPSRSGDYSNSLVNFLMMYTTLKDGQYADDPRPKTLLIPNR